MEGQNYEISLPVQRIGGGSTDVSALPHISGGAGMTDLDSG